MTTIQKLLAAFIPVLAVACAAAPASTDSGESGEAVSSASNACVNVKSLSCKSGEEVSSDGCLQSRVFGAAVLGKCVAAAPDAGADAASDACVDTTTLDCGDGEEISEVGCAQSRVSGAHPYGRCVESAADGGTAEDAGADPTCVDETTLDCGDGSISEQGCLQSNVVGAHRYGFCVSQ